MTHYEDVWSFSTAHFTVTLAVADEDTAPEDGLCFPEAIEFAREGGWHWFSARVQVTFGDDDIILGTDYLDGCSYHGLNDFRMAGGYFRDMVGVAVGEARRNLAALRAA